MHTICLKDNWTLTVLGKNVYDIPETPIETKVPSTVYGTLLEKGLIPDPFYRDNELDALKLMENDFAYETEIVIGEEDRKADRLFLHFDGIDTIADVYLNGEKIGSADNMNRVWEYDITDLVAGDAADTVYQVKVILHSPTKFIAEEDTKCPVGGSSDAMPGFPHIRKAACMYGWDWGPRLPDAGLFREASVLAVKTARLAQVFEPSDLPDGYFEVTFSAGYGGGDTRTPVTGTDSRVRHLRYVIYKSTGEFVKEKVVLNTTDAAPSWPMAALKDTLPKGQYTAVFLANEIGRAHV